MGTGGKAETWTERHIRAFLSFFRAREGSSFTKKDHKKEATQRAPKGPPERKKKNSK